MVGRLIRQFRRRRANSTMIGGLIVLTLLLAALCTANYVSQQFFQYQQTVNSVVQYRKQQQVEEELVVNSPGMIANVPWSGCSNNCNMYNVSLSNVGNVGIQITQIYINSTGPAGTGGCNPKLCILQSSSSTTSYGFSQAQAFINPGELNHPLLLYLPSTVTLPNPTPPFPENTVTLVTARGNMFSFQWPFQPQAFGQSQSAFSSGNMKIAYQGSFDSRNEPGPVASGSGGTHEGSGTGYCHQENTYMGMTYPTPTGYAEELMGMSGAGVSDSGVLWFVNPWITGTSSSSTDVMASANGGHTTVYIYVVVVNTGNTQYTPSAGTIDLTWYGSNHMDGYLIGIYYEGTFYCTSCSTPTTHAIPAGFAYYAIFKLTIFTIGNWPNSIDPGASVMFWGAASLTNAPGSSAEDQSYFAGVILLSGLWIRYEATSGGCS